MLRRLNAQTAAANLGNIRASQIADAIPNVGPHRARRQQDRPSRKSHYDDYIGLLSAISLVRRTHGTPH
jgi:hypothetical protein